MCEEAKAQLETLRREIPFDFRLVDIDTDPALRSQYTDDVPVIFLNGKKMAKHRLNPRQFRRQLEREQARNPARS